MVRIAHLSDIGLPILSQSSRGWRRQWSDVSERVNDHKPDLIVITGDVLASAWPRSIATSRLTWFLKELLPETFQAAQLLVVPSKHDIHIIDAMRHNRAFSDVFQQLTHDRGGWQSPIDDRVHLFTLDSKASAFAHGRVDVRDLGVATIPQECSDRHVHIFVMHKDLKPAGQASKRLTELDGPRRLVEVIATLGFDIVFHGHRQLSTFYAGAHASQRRCLAIAAPRVSVPAWHGFNIVEVGDNRQVAVYNLTRAYDGWLLPQLVALHEPSGKFKSTVGNPKATTYLERNAMKRSRRCTLPARS